MQEQTCRHEYVRIYQRRLKGLERRLCVTPAYLPVGFKLGDFSHLSEGSFCFCSKCRTRLYPRRTQGEKLAARQLAQDKAAELAAAELAAELGTDLQEEPLPETAQDAPMPDIHVEELEQEAVDMQDIEAEGVKLADDDEANCLNDEEV